MNEVMLPVITCPRKVMDDSAKRSAAHRQSSAESSTAGERPGRVRENRHPGGT